MANRESKKVESALVTAAKSGDQQAFAELIRRYEHRILCVVQRITKNREDAEDVAQESFHRAYQHLARFEERSRFSTWLTRIAINEAFMLLRRRGSKKEVDIACRAEHEGPVPEAFVDRYPSPEASCWHSERKKILQKAINRLSFSLRTTVLLREFQELSLTETAQALGITVTTVKARLHHGRRKLRTRLRPELIRDLPEFYPAK